MVSFIRSFVLFWGCWVGALAFVDLAMSPQIGDDREVTATAINITRESCSFRLVNVKECRTHDLQLTLLSRVAVHVSLKRAWPGEALVANFTLVLLL